MKISVVERIEGLERSLSHLIADIEAAKRKLKPTHCFDLQYWTTASTISQLSIQVYETEVKLAIQHWRQDTGEEDLREWWQSPEAHQIVDKLRAATYERNLYSRQAEQIHTSSPTRRFVQSLFTTSYLGLSIPKAGMGARSRSEQSRFKKSLISVYNARKIDPSNPKTRVFFETATGRFWPLSGIKAAHIAPHSLGPELMQAIFGEDVKGELDTPLNGLLLLPDVEIAMDDGAIAIVPDIPNDPTPDQVTDWETKEPKEYKWRVVDPLATILNEPIEVISQGNDENEFMTIRDLDGRQLAFRSTMRPRARYLYFLFVVGQLRLAWRGNNRQDPSAIMKGQIGKGVWATPGRYFRQAFLRALAEEIGHDTSPGDDADVDRTGILALAQLIQGKRDDEYESDDEPQRGCDFDE